MAKAPQHQRGSFRTVGREGAIYEYPCRIVGSFAVHHPVHGVARRYEGMWCVTHLSTGLRLNGDYRMFAQRQHAVACATELDTILDWSKVSKGSEITGALREQCLATVRRWAM